MSEQKETKKRSIREVNGLVRALVEAETLGYPFWVSGLVKRYYLSDFGHVYFTLYDFEGHSIDCMIPERARGSLDFTLANGLEVKVFGTIQVYEKRAQVQIMVEKARLIERPDYVPDKSTVERLQDQGLWPKRKIPLPDSISRIGLVTSKQSEALRDFENTYRDENGKASINVVDVRIQGEKAANEIADAIERLNREKQVDVIVLARGGGRAADLAVFNDYLIAEAICRSTIPVVTGIGHQRDDSFADQVADLSSYTPSLAAVELARQSMRANEQLVVTQAKSSNLPIAMIVILVIVVVALLIVILSINSGV